MNNVHTLIDMANRIGAFFESLPDREEGLRGVATHIRNFWDPRMRADLLGFLREHPDGALGESRLDPFVRQSIEANQELLTPKTADAHTAHQPRPTSSRIP
ncbi:MAG: formate dehydrogenase subunit delta [Candidimonas sp.]